MFDNTLDHMETYIYFCMMRHYQTPKIVTITVADDVAAILSGQLGLRYFDQCLDLEKRLHSFLDELEFYSILTDQSLNHSKTEAMFSAHAIGHPKFDLFFPSNNLLVQWKSNYKYLGYIVCTNLGWGKFILHMETKIRKCVSLNRRLTLFNAFVLPIFSWIFPIFPLFTSIQQMHLSHFYFYCLRRVLFRLDINSEIFSFCLDAPSLEDRCFNYWNKFLICLADNADGTALLGLTKTLHLLVCIIINAQCLVNLYSRLSYHGCRLLR